LENKLNKEKIKRRRKNCVKRTRTFPPSGGKGKKTFSYSVKVVSYVRTLFHRFFLGTAVIFSQQLRHSRTPQKKYIWIIAHRQTRQNTPKCRDVYWEKRHFFSDCCLEQEEKKTRN
jgi:hypothetical protein